MKLSVVITAYNVSKYIKECIDSVKNQNNSHYELELIVVEDKSTDDTLSILKGIDGIKIIENEHNVGAGLSRRIGIQHATGEYIMLVDGDDYLEDSFHLDTLVAKAIETNADVVSGGIKILREDGSSDSTSYGNYTCEGYDKVTKFWGDRIVFICNKIIRKSMYDKIPYCHRRYIEDTSVIIPILWLANKVEYVDTVGYVYRMRPDSLTHESSKFKHTIFAALCWCDLMEFFSKNDPNVLEITNIKRFITGVFDYFNTRTTTIQEIAPYANEFAELMLRLVNLVKFTGIDFKPINVHKGNG